MKRLGLFALIALSLSLQAQTLTEALGYGLPVVVVNTVNGEEPKADRIDAPEGCLGVSITNVTKVPGRVRIYYPGVAENPVFDSGNYDENKSGMLFKVRGNTSAIDDKRPFCIMLQKEADMLLRDDQGMADKEWALLKPKGWPQYPCPIATMIGNKITEILRVADWIPEGKYVNLIVNDDFRGFYYLTETIERNEKCRINVDEQTGYISEIDPYWWNKDVCVESPRLLRNAYKFTFKYPDSSDITEEQLDAFREYLDLFDTSLTDGTYPLYIDVESCARWLLAHQILGTWDAAGSNMFIIRRDNHSKLQMGPLWDFDSILRVSGTWTSIMSVHYFGYMLTGSPNRILARKMIHIWESEKERITSEITNFYESLSGTDYAQAIDKSIDADHKRWAGKTLDDISTTVEKLRKYFPARAEDIDSLLQTLNTTDGAIQWPEGTFVLRGTEQPVIGDRLSISSSLSDMSEFSFRWIRGDALGNFNESEVLSEDSAYVVTDSDYEHWLRVTVCDKAGETVYSKDTWTSKLPVLYIDTEDGNPITSKENYVNASLRIQGNSDFEPQYTGSTEIRGRGNSSWRYPQKAYKLKLNKKTGLFGFGKSKHWVLVPNYNDKTCLRNFIASQLARRLGILATDMTWVDVVINGEVKGCYMLSQHVRVEKHSVDIFDWEDEAEDVADALFDSVRVADALADTDKELLEETMKKNLAWITNGMVSFKGKLYNLSDYGLKKEYDITKGYLFEVSQKTSGTHFLTPQNLNIQVAAPEYLSTNSEMLSYVTRYWEEFEAAYSQIPNPSKNLSKYTDMKSLVAVWLVNEIMGQNDLINSRFSYIADDGKLHFGPAWDFDHGSGCISATRKTDFFITFDVGVTTPAYLHSYTYYQKWFPDPVLCQMAYYAYWDVARPFIMDFISEGGELDARYAHVAEAGKTNDIVLGDTRRTSALDVDYLRNYLRNHTNWLDEQFQSVETLIEAMNKICTYPCDPNAVGIPDIMEQDRQTATRKVIRDKHLYIIKDGETYSIDGKKIHY